MSEIEKTADHLKKKWLGVSEFMLIAIFIIAGGGVAITDMSPNWGYWFWLGLVPLLAVTSLYRSWIGTGSKREGGVFWTLRVQIFHWLGLLGALEIVFLLYTYTNRIDAAQSGLVSLLVVALATFLAGIHFHWHFAVLGIMLALSTLAMAWVEAFVWVVIPLVAIAVAVVLFFTHRMRERAHE
ncbi:MAG: hypothetical protein VX252_09840 [Myxococcota bacterium]|nr:hypothetical protein [Myxococcota bacterium]